MRPSIASVAVVFLVVTAGCGGFVGDDDETATDDSPDDELLPGLTESAVTDRHALLNEHYTALEEEGYRLDWDRTVSDASGAVLEFENGSTVVAANRTLARERFVGENESVERRRGDDPTREPFRVGHVRSRRERNRRANAADPARRGLRCRRFDHGRRGLERAVRP